MLMHFSFSKWHWVKWHPLKTFTKFHTASSGASAFITNAEVFHYIYKMSNNPLIYPMISNDLSFHLPSITVFFFLQHSLERGRGELRSWNGLRIFSVFLMLSFLRWFSGLHYNPRKTSFSEHKLKTFHSDFWQSKQRFSEGFSFKMPSVSAC